jgi:hypothetical protein
MVVLGAKRRQAMKTKTLKCWVGKRKASDIPAFYELGYRKIDWHASNGFVPAITGYCTQTFETLTGIKLKPGEVRRVEITFKVV